MIDRRAALDSDRLPWLSDGRTAARKSGWSGPLAWGIAAALLIGGSSYWVGLNSFDGSDMASAADQRGAARITLPRSVDPVQASEPQMAELDQAPAAPAAKPVRKVSAVPSKPRRIIVANPADPSQRDAGRDESSDESAPERVTYWPADQSEGATGRLVRVGTFRSIHQAKVGWRQIVRHHPGLGTLRATVVANPSLRNGRTYYRLQFGTTSQAHSEILCQRMRMIAQSCIVVGLKEA